MTPPVVLLESHRLERDPDSFGFSGFRGEVVARCADQVRPTLDEVERAVERGCHAAGFVAYEAAPGLDASLCTHAGSAPGSTPLVWFGLFAGRDPVRPGSLAALGGYRLSAWEPSIGRAAYDGAIGRIRDYIAAGDTYQANFTYRLRAAFEGDDRALYADLCGAQRASYCAYLATGTHRILSASPELFFSLRDGVLTARPMKGTRPRAADPEEDEALAVALRDAAKDRAENVMIVDLLRNDLGRVSQLGSVVTPRLWEVEGYETVWQMTSTVTARLRPDVGLADVLAALFPCGSVTGAPKVRTMQILTELEDSPRGVYTGAIGFVSPGPEARFSVPIRTVWLDTLTGVAEYGVGGGITWDSTPAGEYEECQVKARLLRAARRGVDVADPDIASPATG